MIKHYFKIAIRNLGKQKGLSFINVFGLSVGLACFALFLLYAVNEFGFDRFHKNADNIYRVYRWSEAMHGEEAHGTSYLPIPLGPAMKQDFPEVESFVRLKDSWDEKFIRVDNKVSRGKITAADPAFFSVFSFKTKYGDAINSLTDQHHIVLAKNKAMQLFGQENAVGKTVEIKIEDDFVPFIVSAVAEDAPSNSTIQFDIIYSFEYFLTTNSGKRGIDKWTHSGYQTFVQLRPGSKLNSGSVALQKFRSKYHADEEASLRKDSLWTAHGSPISYRL